MDKDFSYRPYFLAIHNLANLIPVFLLRENTSNIAVLVKKVVKLWYEDLQSLYNCSGSHNNIEPFTHEKAIREYFSEILDEAETSDYSKQLDIIRSTANCFSRYVENRHTFPSLFIAHGKDAYLQFASLLGIREF